MGRAGIRSMVAAFSGGLEVPTVRVARFVETTSITLSWWRFWIGDSAKFVVIRVLNWSYMLKTVLRCRLVPQVLEKRMGIRRLHLTGILRILGSYASPLRHE